MTEEYISKIIYINIYISIYFLTAKVEYFDKVHFKAFTQCGYSIKNFFGKIIFTKIIFSFGRII